MRQQGVGTITDKGLAMIAECLSNGRVLKFKHFVLSSKAEFVTTMVDSGSMYSGMTLDELETELDTNDLYKNVVQPGTQPINNQKVIFPLLAVVPKGGIEYDANIHAIFVTATELEENSSTHEWEEITGEYVFYQGCFFYDDNNTPTGFSDDGYTIPITYTYGSSLVLHINIEITSEFPETAFEIYDANYAEIEQHNSSDDAHNEMKLSLAAYTAVVARSVRDLKDKVDNYHYND